MACVFKYGSYTHDAGTVGLSASREALRDELDQMWAHKIRWALDITLISQLSEAAARSAIKTKQDALIAAYAVENVDAVLYQPGGSTATHHSLLTANTWGGVRVIQPPSFTQYRGAEGVTYATAQAVIEAVVPISGYNQISSFTESVSFDCDPVIAHIPTKIGLPVRQRLRQHPVFRVRQTGSAKGRDYTPSIPPPIWPGDTVKPIAQKTIGHPKRMGDKLYDFPVSWTYEFEMQYQPSGLPNRYGVTYP